MNCDAARAAISAAADGEPSEDVTAHVAGCAGCAAFESGIRTIRTALRFEILDGAPDVVPAVLASIGDRRRFRWMPVAAALVAGIVAGSTFMLPSGHRDIAVAALPRRIVAAQRDVVSLAAELTVVEHHPRRLQRGSLRYLAPETLELHLGDTSISMGNGALTMARPGEPTIRRHGLEPFADDVVAPLDLVLPAGGFTAAAAPVALGHRTIDGRAVVGVSVTAAQVATLLDSLRTGGAREVHPTDAVALWLDETHLVPLEIVVRASAGIDRSRWAAARSYDERVGDTVLEARLSDVAINDPRRVDGLTGPPDAGDDAGFRTGRSDAPAPTWLPVGMEPYRSGSVGDVAIRSWTDGRAWIKVQATRTWGGGRLFGIGPVVRRFDLDGGTAYAAENGTAVALHSSDRDVVVSGSVEPAALRAVAGSLGITGRVVPRTWAESSTVTLQAARQQVPGLLTLDHAGFGRPAVRADSHTVVLVYAGPGERAVVVASRQGTVLAPPLDPDAVGVTVRGATGRWSPTRGELEWIEAGRLWSLRSTTIAVGELVALADSMRQPR